MENALRSRVVRGKQDGEGVEPKQGCGLWLLLDPRNPRGALQWDVHGGISLACTVLGQSLATGQTQGPNVREGYPRWLGSTGP